MLDFTENSFCTGCSACVNICPKKCISMQWKEGFLYPEIDMERCVDCHLCENNCPIKNPKDSNSENNYIYAFQNKNELIRDKSTSGGFFMAAAKKTIEKGGTVCAATFDENMHVVHKMAKTPPELYGMYGSKYVQSDLKNSFNIILSKLKKEKTVLFAGTPCQVEGLLSFIDEKYQENLYTIDFLCYGVPSPKLYCKWIDYLEEKRKSKVKYINFRDKKYGYAGVNVKITFEDGSILEDKIDSKTYLKTMFSKIGLRKSCYKCPYRANVKKCDITMGDMWDIGRYNPAMDDDKGTTKVQIHTKKGEKLYNELDNIQSTLIETIHNEKAKDGQKFEQKFVKPHPRHEEFRKDIDILDYESLIKKYLAPTYKDYLASVTKPIINKMPFARLFFRKLKNKKMQKSK